MGDIEKVTSHKNDEEYAARQLRWLTSGSLADDIVECYREYGVEIKINDKKTTVHGDGLKFKIELGWDATPNQVRKFAETAKIKLNLPELKPIYDNQSLYLSTARNLQTSYNNELLQIMKYPEYATALESQTLAHSIGVDSNGNPVIVDLADYPHAMVCGTTNSGKTVSLKCMITSLLRYQPHEVNLLLVDRLLQFSAFADVPHLSYPIIEDKETFADVMLVLQDEMERRLRLKKADRDAFEKCPHIVCIIDEFPSFLRGLDKERTSAVENAINSMLEEARHERIHLILTVRNPTSSTIGNINVSELRTKLVFQVTNPQKSLNALGIGKVGAEKLKGKGDMYFYQGGEPIHLQGVNITDEEIANIVKVITSSFEAAKESSAPDDDIRMFPRGRYGFTITDDDIQGTNTESNTMQDVVSTVSSGRAYGSNKDGERLANAILWALTQDFVSINMIASELHMNFHNAKKIMQSMCNIGVVDTQQQGPKGQAILPKSIDDLSDEVRSLLKGNGYTEEAIIGVFEKRTGISRSETDDVQEDSFDVENETEDEQADESGLAFSGQIPSAD